MGADDLEVLTANSVDVVTEADLRTKLARGAPLRVKLGIDPTATDIHLGFAVVLRKLREFQDRGHTAVLILGDFTALVGDPSGRSSSRPQLTSEEIAANAETYVEQIKQILAPEPLEVHRNSTWLGAMQTADVMRLAATTTVAQMLERDDFQKRYASGAPISLMEFFYPLLQAQDSVEVRADVELGGSDQLFNNLMGRHLQVARGQEGQVVLTLPLLVGLDGTQKMSKSLGNYVGITEPPGNMFGKLMSVPDELMPQYFALATAWPPERAREVQAEVASGALRPVDAKRLLARTVVDLYHGAGEGESAEAEFDRVFKSHDEPTDILEHPLDTSDAVDGRIRLASVLRQAGLASSNKQGRRLIEQGGVKRDGEVVSDPDADFAPSELDGAVLQVGRRRWARIRST
jgi:tyrosyl-tRNA synthetase